MSCGHEGATRAEKWVADGKERAAHPMTEQLISGMEKGLKEVSWGDVPGSIQTALLEEQEELRRIQPELEAPAKPWHDDAGKPQFELIPQWGLLELAKVAVYGKKKYSKHNYAVYADGWNWLEPVGSILRHTFAFLRGEWTNEESGLSHLAHAAFNALMLIDLHTHGKGTDDRSPFAFMATVGDRNTPEAVEPSPMLAIGAETPKKWRRRVTEMLTPLTPETERDSWKAKVDGLNREAVMSIPIDLPAQEIPEEELHDDLTFPAFAPEVSAYWRARMEDAVEEIMSVEAKEGVVTCGN